MSILFYAGDAVAAWPPELPWTEEFIGSDDSQPDPTAWDLDVSSLHASIQNNKLNFSSPGNNTNPFAIFYPKIILVGDFDLQFDFDITTLTAPSDAVSYACSLFVLRESDDTIIAYIGRGRSQVDQRYASTGPVGYDTYIQSDGTGKLRITRVNNEVTVFIWSGSQWEYNGNVSGRVTANSESGNLYITLSFEQENNSTVNSNIDNFTITSADGLLAR
jgi:hypothetical protein